MFWGFLKSLPDQVSCLHALPQHHDLHQSSVQHQNVLLFPDRALREVVHTLMTLQRQWLQTKSKILREDEHGSLQKPDTKTQYEDVRVITQTLGVGKRTQRDDGQPCTMGRARIVKHKRAAPHPRMLKKARSAHL